MRIDADRARAEAVLGCSCDWTPARFPYQALPAVPSLWPGSPWAPDPSAGQRWSGKPSACFPGISSTGHPALGPGALQLSTHREPCRDTGCGLQGSPSPDGLRPWGGGQTGPASSMRRCVSRWRQEGGPHSCSRPHSRLHASQGQGQTAAWPRPTPGPFWETRHGLFLLSDNTTEAAAVTYLCCPRAMPQRRLCAPGLCRPPRPHSPNLRQGWLEEGPQRGP